MKDKNEIIQLIRDQGVLPLYFHKDIEVSINVLKALYAGGVKAVEYTNRGQAALDNFKVLRKLCDDELEGMYLGIGTVKDKQSANNFIAAGADFIVCPGLIDEVIEVADQHQLLLVPGCMTPSEIIRAENQGIRLIKLFPGSLLGPDFVKSIKSLFPGLLFMPTGGVDITEGNLKGWFEAGVCAVGMGSKLIRKELLADESYSEIKETTLRTINLVHSIRKTL